MNARITHLAGKFRLCKEVVEKLTDQLKLQNQVWDETEKELLDALVEEGVNSVSLEGLGRFSMVTKNHLSVNAANKPKFFEYLKASGNGGILKEDVNPRTLTAFLKTHLEELIAQEQEQGSDLVDARTKALAILNAEGASYFSEKTIQFKGE